MVSSLQDHITLGDVVIATHVYAYHGGTSQDDGLKARPRVWEISHGADQIARHLDRSGAWMRQLPSGAAVPKIHLGPIAAGRSFTIRQFPMKPAGFASTTTTRSPLVYLPLQGSHRETH